MSGQLALLPGAMKRTASISANRLYRWSLTREWGDGGRACWVMLNPSTADAEKDDPTLCSIIKRSQAWGYGSLVVVNLIPFRTSSPDRCKEWLRCGPHQTVTDTNATIVMYEAQAADLVVAAWGNHEWATRGLKFGFGHELYCIGTNDDGSPRHPLARAPWRLGTPPQLWSPTCRAVKA